MDPPVPPTPPVLQTGLEPVGMTCPHCQEDITTRIVYKNGKNTHIVAIIFFVLIGCCCGCIIPYVIKRWKNVEHFCPKCERLIGVHTPSIL